MTRIVILGGPKTGKTTLAGIIDCPNGEPSGFVVPVRHTDDLIHLGWSEASQHVADEWLTQPGPWIIEGVAAVRGLRKWHAQHPHQPPPVDRVIYLTEPHEPLTSGQRGMATSIENMHREIVPWLLQHGVVTEVR